MDPSPARPADPVTLAGAAARILDARLTAQRGRALLVAISGIDGAGKGFLAEKLRDALHVAGCNAVTLGIDGWLNLPARRFDPADPARHFYQHAIRFAPLFDQLVGPLRDTRSVRLEADFTEETATAYRRHVYEYRDADVILLEGIYLLKRELRARYDLSIWVECTFAAALERALARGQEGLAPEETRRAYETVYFPAQRIHFERDDPRGAANLTIFNDPRLERSTQV